MWGVVTQLPVRAWGLGLRVWGLYLQLLSLGLWALLLCLLLFLRGVFVCVQKLGRAVLTAARSVALAVHICAVSIFLQGVAWSAQLAGSWVTLHLWLSSALLETLRRILSILLSEKAARWLIQAAVWACRGLAWVQGMTTFVQLCAHTFFLGMFLCMHVCFSAISSRVRVRVHMPFSVSLPFTVHAPVSLGLKVRLRDQRHDRAKGKGAIPPGEVWEEQKSLMSGSPKPIRRREAAPSRRELSPVVVPSAATLIIVVCVGFLVLMVVLGLVRIHSLHRRVSGAGGPPGASSDPKDPDLFWDDSALTIIVNPMESYQNRQVCVAGAAGGQQEDEDSSDSEAADSPSSDERRIIETPPHRY